MSGVRGWDVGEGKQRLRALGGAKRSGLRI